MLITILASPQAQWAVDDYTAQLEEDGHKILVPDTSNWWRALDNDLHPYAASCIVDCDFVIAITVNGQINSGTQELINYARTHGREPAIIAYSTPSWFRKLMIKFGLAGYK